MVKERTMLPSPPLGWGGDELSAYWDIFRSNMYGSFANLPEENLILRLVDEAYTGICDTPMEHDDWMRPLFARKSHAIFRAAAQLAMGGQFSEVFVLLRSCLESALCAHYLHVHVDLQNLWLRRHESEENRKKVRKKFQSGRLKVELDRAAPELFSRVDELYEMCIDLGGHPNEKWLTSTLRQYEEDGEQQFYSQYLTNDPGLIVFAIRSCARTGLAALGVYGLVFPKRWEALPMRYDLEALADLLFEEEDGLSWTDS